MLSKVFALTCAVVAICVALTPANNVLVSASCECGYGKVAEVSPKCVCLCNVGYVLPACLFGPAESAMVRVVYNISTAKFASGGVEQQLKDALGLRITTSDAYFRTLEDENTTQGLRFPNQQVTLYTMRGSLVEGFLNNVSNKVAFVVDQKITFAELVIPLPSRKAQFGDNVVIFQTAAGKSTAKITVYAVGWLLGALAVCLFLCFVECCCLANNTKRIEAIVVLEAAAAAAAASAAVIINPLAGIPQDGVFKADVVEFVPDGGNNFGHGGGVGAGGNGDGEHHFAVAVPAGAEIEKSHEAPLCGSTNSSQAAAALPADVEKPTAEPEAEPPGPPTTTEPKADAEGGVADV